MVEVGGASRRCSARPLRPRPRALSRSVACQFHRSPSLSPMYPPFHLLCCPDLMPRRARWGGVLGPHPLVASLIPRRRRADRGPKCWAGGRTGDRQMQHSKAREAHFAGVWRAVETGEEPTTSSASARASDPLFSNAASLYSNHKYSRPITNLCTRLSPRADSDSSSRLATLRDAMSWYPPPPPPHYAQDYAAAGYPPQPHYGATATPGYAAPPQQQQQGGYAYGAAAGHYAQPPPPPPVGYYQPPPAAYPQPQPQQPPIMHHHHHQQQPRYPDYAAPAPAPPPPVQHQYTPPPPPVTVPPLKEGELRPPPDVAHDPNSFRRYFKQQLDHLTYNSKPVITSLTLFAHEHAIRMASVVAQCFDEHLRTVSSLSLFSSRVITGPSP